MVLLCYQSTPGFEGYAQHLSLDSLIGEDILDREQDVKILHNLLSLFFQNSNMAKQDAFYKSGQIVEHINNVVRFNGRPLIKLAVAITDEGRVEVCSLEAENSFSVFGEVSKVY